MEKMNVESLVEKLKGKIEIHNEKLEAHEATEKILSAEYLDLQARNEDPEKIERTAQKLYSTIKNVEYHKATSKTYGKVIEMLK